MLPSLLVPLPDMVLPDPVEPVPVVLSELPVRPMLLLLLLPLFIAPVDPLPVAGAFIEPLLPMAAVELLLPVLPVLLVSPVVPVVPVFPGALRVVALLLSPRWPLPLAPVLPPLPPPVWAWAASSVKAAQAAAVH